MKIIYAKSIFLVISTCFVLTFADRSCAIELYKNLSLEYGDLNPPCADSKDVKAATDYKAAADVKTAVDAKVPESEKIAVPGVLTAKYGLNISKDFLPYVGAGMAYRIQSEVKPDRKSVV